MLQILLSLDKPCRHVDSISDLNRLCGDGSTKFIYKCKSKRCQLKNIFLHQKGLLVLHKNVFFILLHRPALFILFIWFTPQDVGEAGQKIIERF